MYVDESGDPGKHEYGSPHFILSGLIVSHNDWFGCLQKLKAFRKSIKEKYGLNQRTEIHANELIRINKNSEYQKIHKTQRINILKDYCSQNPVLFDSGKILNICIKKEDYPDSSEIQKVAWNRLIQRFDIYLKRRLKIRG
ncbi:MAG: DUF3800 domain-containing protein [Bacteroidales bacterium]|nr:DUF3800 domain-containing protein [Bacteroidales bacterium]